MLTYHEAHPFNLPWLALHLREEDLVELVLATGKRPEDALNRRVLEIEGARAITVRAPSGRTCAMFGSIPQSCCKDIGTAWFLATPEVERHSKSLLKTITPYIDSLSEPYPGGLIAWMWEENRMHRRWAEAVGFSLTGDEMRLRGATFLKIHRPSPCALP